MPDKPYADRGLRLRARRKELQRTGLLESNLDKVAAKAGVTRTAFQMWERGETWPTAKNKARLLPLLRWSEQELDHGPSEGERLTDMGYHPVSQIELEVLALFRALGSEQADFIHKLKARIAARQTISEHTGREPHPVSDAQVRDRMPVTGKPKRPPAKTR